MGGPRHGATDAAGPAIINQLMVNGADAATSYGVVVFLSNCTVYEPGSTVGGPEALMSPCVSASLDTGNERSRSWTARRRASPG